MTSAPDNQMGPNSPQFASQYFMTPTHVDFKVHAENSDDPSALALDTELAGTCSPLIRSVFQIFDHDFEEWKSALVFVLFETHSHNGHDHVIPRVGCWVHIVDKVYPVTRWPTVGPTHTPFIEHAAIPVEKMRGYQEGETSSVEYDFLRFNFVPTGLGEQKRSVKVRGFSYPEPKQLLMEQAVVWRDALSMSK